MADNQTVVFDLGKTLTPDEYMVVLRDNKGTSKLGLWTVPYDGEDSSFDKVRFYIEGYEVEDYYGQACVFYVNTPEITLLPASR